MKAIRIHHFGGPEVLQYEEAPLPQIKRDEVLVKVHASSVNPVDWKIREGKSASKFPTSFPLTLGWDVSGVVEQTGEDVKKFKKGDMVYGRPFPSKNGAYAEYVAVSENEIAIKPSTITHDEAASVPLACLTAWQGIFDHGKLEPNQRVLIHGAAGGVGSFAVQLAKWKKAYAIGTGSETSIDFIKDLGADEAIDYNKVNLAEKVKDIDLVFDLIGGDTQKKSMAVLKNNGRIVTTVKPEEGEKENGKNIKIEGFMAQSDPRQLEQIAQLIDGGQLLVHVAQVFPLEKAAQAQMLSEGGHTKGKIVLEVVSDNSVNA